MTDSHQGGAAATLAGGELAGQGRRLAGFIFDAILLVVTLVIGWFIWFLFVARRGQSPGKQLLQMRVVREDGEAAGLGRMLLRDIAVRWLALAAVDVLLGLAIGDTVSGYIVGAVFLVAALWCVWDAQRQCLWDKVTRTRVVLTSEAEMGTTEGGSAPTADEVDENLRTLAELKERGFLTDEEYEERRAQEQAQL